MKLQLKRKIIVNKRNGQASVTIPSKFLDKLDIPPKEVLIDFSKSIGSKRGKSKMNG
jgi:hypothetical protein